jgi:hypothetical protein
MFIEAEITTATLRSARSEMFIETRSQPLSLRPRKGRNFLGSIPQVESSKHFPD